MKINVAWQSKSKSGCGYSFASQFEYGLQYANHELSNWQDADVVLIPSASVITKELFREMKEANKKIVLRIDNALKDSRNRGAGMNRIREFAQGADGVVYQCAWAQGYLAPFTKREGVVIHNGIDTELFNKTGDAENLNDKDVPVYLYSCASKGESKRWEWAWWQYQMIHRDNPDSKLIILGNVPGGAEQWGFDFFMGERYKYYGMVLDRELLARIYRGSDYLLATYSNDAFSQTYIEALCCGVKLYDPDLSGGTKEMLEIWDEKGREYFGLDRMVSDYLSLFATLEK